MGNYEQLKAAVSNVIKTNGTQSITGQVLQNTLLTIISSLGDNYQFVGIATTSTNPGTPDQNVFYLAGEGTYSNFSNLTIDVGQLGVLKWNGSWSKQVLEIGSGGGNMILDWNTDVATTRKQVLTKYRKPGVQISYKEPGKGWINEQYVGTLTTDTEWAKDSNWDEIPNQILISNLERKLTENDYFVYNEVYSNITKTRDGNIANQAIQSNGTIAFANGGFQANIYEVEQDKKYLVKIESNASDGNNKFIPYVFYNVKPTTSVTVSNVISVAEASELQGTNYFIITAPEEATYILVETKGTTNIELKEITDSHIKEIDNSIIDLGNRDYEGKAGLQNGCYPIFGFNIGNSSRVSYTTNANYGYGNLVNHDGKIIMGFISFDLGKNPIYSVRVNEETGEVVRLKQLQIKSKTLYNKVVTRDNYYLYELDANSYIVNDDEQIAISVIKSFNAFRDRVGKIFNINADLVSGNIEATTDKDIAIGYIYADDDLGFTESDRQNIIKSQNMTFDDVVLNIVDETALKSSVHSSVFFNSSVKRMVFLFNMSNNVILGIYSESDRISNQNMSYGIATKLGENLFEFGENIETLQTGRVVIFSKPLVLSANQYMYIENTSVFGYTKIEVDNKIDVLVNNNVEYSITQQAPNFALIQPINVGLYKNPYKPTLQQYIAPRYFTETFNVECSNPIITTYESISPTQIQEEKIFEGRAYIMVPYKYGLEGKKKYPLALYCHAGNTEPTDIQNDQIATYLCSLGYVVAGTTTPIGYATELGVADRLRNAGNYACMNAYVQLYKYLTENYKIDIDRVFAFGASQGGFTSLNLAEITNIPIRAISLNCPVLSMYYGQWFLDKENVKAYYGFDDAITYQTDKVIGFDPYIRNAENIFTDLSESAAPTFINEKTLSDVTMKRFTNIPIRIFAGTADSSVGYIIHQVFTKAVKNAGGNISLTIWEGKGHMASDVIGTIEYTGLDSKDRGNINVTATAYETGLWFSRYGGIKPIKPTE